MEQLRTYAKELNIDLSDKQLEQFRKYYDLLLEWNSFMNLTSITEYDEVLKKHFIDSISLLKATDTDLVKKGLLDGAEISLLDVGCGAGFPSIPLKIAFPNLKVTMLDSLNKRIKFLNEVIDVLELDNIQALHGRAEDYAKPDKLRENFDICVSRAVANLSTLSEYCIPYVRKGGVFIAYKSEEFKNERENAGRAISVLGGEIEKVYEYTLPCSDFFRCLCVVRKKKNTPSKYPRKAGLPGKEPL